MSMRRRSSLLRINAADIQSLCISILFAFIVTGCSGGEGDPNADAMPLPDVPPSMATEGVDVLFVIDNSGSMSQEQASLAANFQRFISNLETTYGRLPDLHIGVISTDMGAGANPGTGCSATGDDGSLHTNTACGIDDAYIIDIDDGAGGRIQNHDNSLADAFSCISQLGINGCGFEQPLNSLRRALDGSNPGNDGFLRDGAMLAVVILSDEDDCSVSDPSMFDTTQNDINAPLGPLESFRCFEFGVRCEPDDPRTTGERQQCTPRLDSPYMPNVQHYIDFLKQLKPPGEVIVATIQGDPSPVTVNLDADDDNHPKLAPSCVSASGEAAPGVRLDAFQAGFPQRNLRRTICTENLDSHLGELGTLIGTLLP